MKRPLLTCLVFLSHALSGGLQALTLTDLNAEYTAKRSGGLLRLNEATKQQLEAAKKAQMSAGNLAGANSTNAIITALPTITANPAVKPNTTASDLPPEAGRILAEHSTKVCTGVVGLNKLYVPKFEDLKTTLLKSGDLDNANAAAARAKQLTEEIDALTPMMAGKDKPVGKDETEDKPITIEGYVDGNTELHITKEGIYWSVLGGEAKVGMNDDAKDPCYVNGSRWKPKWRTQGTRGPDMCDLYPFPLKSLDLVVDSVSTTHERYGKVQVRTATTGGMKGDHYVVNIPDPEGGAAWYKIRLKSAAAK